MRRIPPGRLRFLKLQGRFTDGGLARVLSQHGGLRELSLDIRNGRLGKRKAGELSELTGQALLPAKKLRRLEVAGLPSAVVALAGAKRLAPELFELEELVLHSPSESDLKAGSRGSQLEKLLPRNFGVFLCYSLFRV